MIIEEIELVSAIYPILNGISNISMEVNLVSTFSTEMLLVSEISPILEAESKVVLEEV